MRNLEAAGVLPAAARTATGYRLYTDEHLSALHCYQALAQSHGAPTAQRQVLAQTKQALNAISSAVDERLHARVPMSIGELAHLLGVRTSTLRVWENAGLLTPQRLPGVQHRSYDADGVRDARVIRLLRQGHYRFTRIKPVIEELRSARTGTALRSVLEERHAAFTAQARAMLHGAALLHQHPTKHTDSEIHPAP